MSTTAPDGSTRLYSLTVVDQKTGARLAVYGHVTANVIDEYWRDYACETHSVVIAVITDAELTEILDTGYAAERLDAHYLLEDNEWDQSNG